MRRANSTNGGEVARSAFPSTPLNTQNMELFVFTGGRKPKDNTLPTMTEVVPQLSVEEIFRDYCRGVLHPSRQGMYDPDYIDDDNFDEVEPFDDLSEIFEPSVPEPAPAPGDEPPSTDPEAVPEEQPEQS